MEINIIRIRPPDGHPTPEPLDTTLLLSIEFVLSERRSITAMIENGELYINSLIGKLSITPYTANAVSIGVTE